MNRLLEEWFLIRVILGTGGKGVKLSRFGVCVRTT